MRNIKAIFKKELYSFFTSPMAYIFLVVFALVNGYFFTNTFFLYDQSNMRSLFSIVPLVYLFFIRLFIILIGAIFPSPISKDSRW